MTTSNTNTSLNPVNFTSPNQPRQRNSVLGSTSPLTNSVNPFSGIFSSRLPSSVMTTMAGGRRQSISRHTSNPGIADNNSTDGLLDSAEASASQSTATAPVTGSSSSAADGNTDAEVPTTIASQGSWNNWGSMVQSISPLLPTTAAFQRAARRVISSRGVGRPVGNRRPNTAPPRSNSTNAESTTTSTNVDDLLGLLAAMEEAVDEAENSSGRTNRNRNRLGSTSTPAVSTSTQNTTTTEPIPSTSGTSRNDIQNRLSEEAEKTKQNDNPDQDPEANIQNTNENPEEVSAVAPTTVTNRMDTDDETDFDEVHEEPGAIGPANENSNTESEEENPDDPYWSGVLWQLPVLCLVLLCKYLQHYFSALMEVLALAIVFHYYNMVVKDNVVSHKAISIGYRKCLFFMFAKIKKNITQFCLRGRAPPPPLNLMQAATNTSRTNGVAESPEIILATNNPESLWTNRPELSVIIRDPNDPNNVELDYACSSSNKEPRGDNKKSDTADETKDAEPKVSLGLDEESTSSQKVHFTNAAPEDSDEDASCVVQINPTYSDKDAKTDDSNVASTTEATSPVETPGLVAIDIESEEPPAEENGSLPTASVTENTVETVEVSLEDEPNANEVAVSESMPGSGITIHNTYRPPQMNNALLESLNISEEETQAQESVLCVIERLRLLLFTLAIVPITVYLFYVFIWEKYAVYWCLLFQPPVVPPYLLPEVLWLTLVVDYLARMITAWLKGWIVIFIWMQRNSFLIHKGRYFPVIEMFSQLYRSFLPIIPWFFYIYASYAYYAQEELKKSAAAVIDARVDTTAKPDISNTLKTLQMLYDHYKSQLNASDFNSTESELLMEPGFRTTVDPGFQLDSVTGESTTNEPSLLDSELNRVTFTTKGVTANQLIGLALFVAYLLHKKLDVVARVSNVWQAIKALKTNSGSYGTKPSNCELESSGGKCPICHDQFRMPILLKCSHIFCESCIVQWFQRERICPMCRAQIADDPMWKDGSTSQMFQII